MFPLIVIFKKESQIIQIESELSKLKVNYHNFIIITSITLHKMKMNFLTNIMTIYANIKRDVVI